MKEIQETLKDGTLVYGWKSESPLTPVAPDYTYYLTEKEIFSKEECESWYEYLQKQEFILLDKFRTSSSDGQTGLGETSITSRFHTFNLLKFDFHLVPELKKSIYDGVQTLLNIIDNTVWQETLYSNAWFNVMRQGEDMKPHFHGYHENSFYSFHIVINAIQPSFTSYYHPVKFQNEAFNVPNKVGYLTMFPNFIPHSVSPNRYKVPRVSIAGDIVPSTWLDIPNKPMSNENYIKLGKIND